MKKILLLILILVFAQWWFTDPSIRVSSHEIRFKYVVKYSGNAGRADDLPMLVAMHGLGVLMILVNMGKHSLRLLTRLRSNTRPWADRFYSVFPVGA
ncbi:MAG: hypothetical protein GXO96_03505 [Nitrospirae bacterium]|nr:hypothetical protein [Candidatus Manganitrophaceae bacterium]